MARNFSETYKCLFCFGSTRSLKLNENHLTPQQIISSCKTHLTQEFVIGIDWTSISSIGESFCQQCYLIVEKVVSLADHLDKIKKDIKELDSNLVNRVSRERIINQQSIDRFNRSEKYFTEDTNYDMSDAEFPVTEDNEDEPETSSQSLESINKNRSQGKTKKKSVKKKTMRKSKEDSTLSTVPKPKVVVLSSEVKRHLENKDTPGYECEKCHKRFSRLTILHRHDCSKPTFECEICNISFSEAGVRRRHMRCHTGEKPYKCETCGRCFSVNRNLKIHMRIHTGERPFKCDICHKAFRDKFQLSKHVLTNHETHDHEKLYKCDLCSKSYHSFQQLKFHSLSRHHKEDRPHKCDTCGKLYISKALLRKHQELVNYHSGEKPFKCEICDKAFTSQFYLNLHVKGHGERFVCEECGKSFGQKEGLAIHTLQHTEKGPFTCETCGKEYSSSFRLKIHIKSYHDETANKPTVNKCVTCNKVFRNKSLLLTHQKALDCNGPPFKCIECDKSFNNQTERERHRILEHLNEKERPTFACEQCQEIFHLKTDLKQHVFKIHPTGEVQCDTCKLQFKDIRSLKYHKYNRKIQCSYCPQKFTNRCDYYLHQVHFHFRGFRQKTGFCKLCTLTFVDPDVFQDHMKSVHPTTSLAIIVKPDDKSSQSSGPRIIVPMNCGLESGQTENSVSNRDGESEESDNGVEITDGGSEENDHEELEIKKEEEFGVEDSEIKTECYYDE